jgi:hypothetical protein
MAIVHRSVHYYPFSAEEKRMASTVLDMSIALDRRPFATGAIMARAPDPEHIELERVRVLEGGYGVTHLRYRVRRGAWSR